MVGVGSKGDAAQPTMSEAGGHWRRRWAAMVSLPLVLAPVSAAAQVYCSKWAEVVDAPTNIRRGPNGQAAIACRLQRNGQRLLVYPVPSRPTDPPPRWLATMVCRPAGQRSAIGLGLPPDYLHRSQVRLLRINAADWLGPTAGQPTSPCEALWRPYDRGETGWAEWGPEAERIAVVDNDGHPVPEQVGGHPSMSPRARASS
jgi:hypothetical protein